MAHITKFILTDDEIPSAWLNVLPLLKQPLDPPLNPATHQPIAPDALAVARGRQVVKPGWAKAFRAKQKPKKAAE